MMRELAVLVPRAEATAARYILRGSGIVADLTPGQAKWWSAEAPAPDLLMEAYFEGNKFDIEELRNFEQRVKQAAGRLLQRYPTTARGVYSRTAFLVVGTYLVAEDWSSATLAITDQATLDAWLA